jgi:transglutaminase-like putative cysteine protease
VLLAALLRGFGIPARLASGYIYSGTEGDDLACLYLHAWTQALINGIWIDLDATEQQPTPHAARILTGFDDKEIPWNGENEATSDQQVDIMVQLITATIEVIDVQY